MEKKNLVMGAIRGYSYDKIEPFVVSFKKTNPNSDLCLLTTHVPNETIVELNKQHVICNHINYRGGALNSWSRFWPALKPLMQFLPNKAIRLIMKKILPLQTVRFFHYKDFLIKNAHLYTNVMLSDVRDVFFQSDLFEGTVYNKVQAIEESGIIGEELLSNVPWIIALYGEDAISSFANEKILCSGTILGPVNKMIQFLNEFEKILIKAKDISIGGSDQGAYNYLIRKYLFDQVDVLEYGVGKILTVSPALDYSDSFKNGYLVNAAGEIVPVVHQYDRSEVVSSAFLASIY